MKYLLDTNACVHILRRRGNPLVNQRFRSQPPGDVALCTAVLAELYYGAERSNNPRQERALVDAFAAPLPCPSFDLPAADVYGRVRADLESRGMPIGDNDYLIAAIALVHGLTLVTHNTKEFSRVPGLPREDWEIP